MALSFVINVTFRKFYLRISLKTKVSGEATVRNISKKNALTIEHFTAKLRHGKSASLRRRRTVRYFSSFAMPHASFYSKINENCHLKIEFCGGKVKGGAPHQT